MSLVHHQGRDFPVFGPETEVLYWGQQFMDAAADDADSFFRRVRILGWSPDDGVTLPEILDYAEEDFAEVAACCGAVVVKHVWGFHNIGRSTPGRPNDHLLLKNHNLVAKVEVVQPPKGRTEVLLPTPEERVAINRSSYEYRERRKKQGRPMLRDPGPDQIRRGVSKEYGERLHYLDLDLGFETRWM